MLLPKWEFDFNATFMRYNFATFAGYLQEWCDLVVHIPLRAQTNRQTMCQLFIINNHKLLVSAKGL